MFERTRTRALLGLLGWMTLAGSTPAQAEKKGLPEGWFITENTSHLYESGQDASGPCEGERSAWLRSTQEATTGHGTFMQAFDAQAFRGKRLRFSAVVRTEDVKGWAGLWMRVEGDDPKDPLAFDNMRSRALRGSTVCTRYDVVLDVAPDAKAIMAGLILSGTGKAWISSVHIEPVDTSTPLTSYITNRTPPPLPARSTTLGTRWPRLGSRLREARPHSPRVLSHKSSSGIPAASTGSGLPL